MSNGWTGGQYSLFRVVLGAWLCIHFMHLAPWAAEVLSSDGALPDGSASPFLFLFPNLLAAYDAPWFVTTIVVSAAVASVLLVLGFGDRFAAVWIWYVLACVFGRNPLTLNPGLPFVGWILLAHAFVPSRPYGSLAALGRPDPGGGWRMPNGIFAAAWIVAALGYTFSGVCKLTSPSWLDGSALVEVLNNPLARPTFLRDWLLTWPAFILQAMTWGALALEILFAPLALFGRLRPWLWGAMLLLHVGLLFLVDFADLTFGMIVLHLFMFDPGWVAPKEAAGEGPERVFYDGECGLCHRWVRFLLAEDPAARFALAPLQGDTASANLPPGELPDSVIVQTADAQILSKSRAVRYMLCRLGGKWRCFSFVAGLVPRGLADWLYDFVARNRKRWFRQPQDLCPIVPAELRQRFLS